MLTLNKIDPKLKNLIKDSTELDSSKVYLLELSKDIPKEQFCLFADRIKECFNNAGVQCIIASDDLIENIYELEGGDKN